MATRSCPECGVQYVATVRRCIDCDVILVDPPGSDADGEARSTGSPLGEGDQIGYELEGWGNQLKVTLEGMLDRAGIGRVWEAGALVVSSTDEEAVDDLIATLEGGDVADLAEDVPLVALVIEGMDADDQAELDARLIAGAVPHSWDDLAALLVAEADEERVLVIIDEVLAGPDEEGDGLAATDTLSALYVATDRLIKNPFDRKPATAYRRAAAALGGLGVPYGFTATEWSGLADEAATLSALVADHADAVPGSVEVDGGDRVEAEPRVDDVSAPGSVGLADADGGDDGGDGDVDGRASTGGVDPGDPERDGGAGGDHHGSDDGAPSEPVEQARAAARRLRERLADLV